MKRRHERVERLKAEQNFDKEEAFRKEYTFTPILKTSFSKQVQRTSHDRNKFYETLYSWQKYYRKRAEERKEIEEQKFMSCSPFVPRINNTVSSEKANRKGRKFVNLESVQINDHNGPFSPLSPLQVERIPTSELKLLRNRRSSSIMERENTFEAPSSNQPLTKVELNMETIEKLRSIAGTPIVEGKDQWYWRNAFSNSSEFSNESKFVSPISHHHAENSVSDFCTELDSAHFEPEPSNVFERLYMVSVSSTTAYCIVLKMLFS